MRNTQAKVSIGITSIVGVLTALAALAPIVGKAVQEGANITAHGPEKYLALAGIIVGGITLAGRYLQSITGISQKVRVGITTVVGWGTALLGFLPVLVKSYSEGAQAIHSPEKYMALAGIVFVVITQAARYLQAAVTPAAL